MHADHIHDHFILNWQAKCPKAAYADGQVKVNLVGGWAPFRPQLGYVTDPVYGHLSGPEKEQNVHNFINMVQAYQACGYKYVYIGACCCHCASSVYLWCTVLFVQRDQVKTPEEKRSFFEFSLCLSRACLGKMFVFIYKWRSIMSRCQQLIAVGAFIAAVPLYVLTISSILHCLACAAVCEILLVIT
jgi:hypothetical protein